jgi:DNA-binding response OmpR family regulator
LPKESRQSNARLLLIEDEPAVARLTELVLVNAGYTVDVLRKHAEAPEAIHRQDYDLIISDTLGPRASGLEGLLPILDAATCPVLLFSAHRFPSPEITTLGFAGMIRKPFDIDELLKTIEQTIASSSDAEAGEKNTKQDGQNL